MKKKKKVWSGLFLFRVPFPYDDMIIFSRHVYFHVYFYLERESRELRMFEAHVCLLLRRHVGR